MNFSEVEDVAHEQVGQVKCLSACDVKKVKLKSEVGSKSKDGRETG